ncbi:hypothetical protein Agub_g12555, partial [Astrephomene gubernaculifera]
MAGNSPLGSAWGCADRGGSPVRGMRDNTAAAGLLAFEALVGPPFASLGLLEGGGGGGSGGGGGGRESTAVVTSAQLQAMQQQAAQVHTLQRRTLMLRLPHGWSTLGVELPAVAVQDGGGTAGGGGGTTSGGGCTTGGGGGACLLVLPSDKPATRAEAVAVEALLLEMLKDPAGAAERAGTWRAEVLGSLCSEAIACIHEAGRLRQAHGLG